jgi:membrane protease YdiL (CAAX protease family)
MSPTSPKEETLAADHGVRAVPAGPIAAWRRRPWLAVADFAAVALIFIADEWHLIPFSKTPFLLVLGWVSLRLRGLRWRDEGLTPYRGWAVTLAVGTACGALMEAFQLFVSQPLLVGLTGKQPRLDDFRVLTGNVPYSLAALALVWTLAAFGEEMVYRGYLMNRVADVGRRTPLAWACAVVVVNVVFGFAHGYQGVTGVLDEGLMGLLLALIYLGTRRNLSVPIVAHGVQDTIDVVLVFLGKYPGM